MATRSKYGMLRVSKLALAVSLAFNGAAQAALPTGAQVASGSAQIGTVGNTMTVTNSPSAIINWQSFSIGQSEAVRFVQQSASSAVLNRVVGGQMSAIMGRLTSNGQVFLINPAGVLVGAGAVIDTASFFASTLQILDQDFLAGKLQFQGDADSGKITNQGWIRTGYGGQVVLMAPNIENSGIIQAPGGKILLAAGQKVTLGSLDMDGLSFQVQAPTDSALNLGQLIADGGVVQVFAGSLKHSGDIRANSLTRDAAGEIVLKARGDVELTAGSTTVANGRTGGTISIESETGTARVAGDVSATGRTGAGGGIDVLGEKVVLSGNATLDASGATAGGLIRAGGDWQGSNPDVKNAQSAFVGAGVTLKADATDQGDGGKIVVWSDGDTRFLGSLSAQGGPNGGNGGNAEVSGKGDLLFIGGANLGAPKGTAGSLLLDPLDLFVDNVGGLNPFIIDENTDFPDHAVTVAPATLAAIVGNVTLFASRDMRLNSLITLVGAGQGLAANAGRDLQIGAGITTNGGNVMLKALGTYTAPGAASPSGGNLTTFAVSPIITAGGSVTLQGKTISAGSMTVAAIAGAVSATSSAGSLELGEISSSSSVTLSSTGGYLYTDALTSTGTVGLTSTGGDINVTGALTAGNAVTMTSSGSISAEGIKTNGGALAVNANNGSFTGSATIDTRPAQAGSVGGAVTITAQDASIYSTAGVSTRSILAGDGSVTLTGETITSNSQPIDTAGNVSLTANTANYYDNASINARINNAASVTATATHTGTRSASINLQSGTTLNATTVTATATNCAALYSCPGATVTLSSAGDVKVGTVTATASPTRTNEYYYGASYADPKFEDISESVSITSSGGWIRGQSSAAQITAADVTLATGAGTGGGIVGASPLKVNVERRFTFRPNGQFDVQLTGTGPNYLDMQIGVAPSGQSYDGLLSKSGQIALDVTASDTTVTVNNFSVTGGFDQRVFNQSPLITLNVPNGALDASIVPATVAVPKGDQTGTATPLSRYYCTYYGGFYCPAPMSIEPLPVTLSARDNLNLSLLTFTREAGTVAKSATFTSALGAVTLGTINADRDDVTVNAATNVSVNTKLTTAGNVTINAATGGADTGNVTIGGLGINTAGGAGSVTINALSALAGNGQVRAGTDTGPLEITSGGAVSISARTIGTGGFANPLDISGPSVTFTTNSTAVGTSPTIGSASGPVVANTATLTINAAACSTSLTLCTGSYRGGTFNVSTGSQPLQTLTIFADPTLVGSGGLAQVASNGKTYTFSSDGTNFTTSTIASTAGAGGGQFLNGTFNFTSLRGNLTLGNINLGPTNGNLNFRTNGSVANISQPVVTDSINLGTGFLTLAADGNVSLQGINAKGMTVVNATTNTSSGNTIIGDSYRTGVTSFTTNGNAISDTGVGNGTFSVTSRGAVSTGALDVSGINFQAMQSGLTTGAIGSLARPATSVTLSTNFSGAGADVTTGAVEANSFTVTALGNISVGGGTGTINASNTTASTVTMTAQSGNISVGNLNAKNVTLQGTGSITAGNINPAAATTAPASILLYSDTSISTGTLDASSITARYYNYYNSPSITTGAIGGINRGTSVSLDANGSALQVNGAISAGKSLTAKGSSINVTGAIGLDTLSTGQTLDIRAGGDLTIGGNVTLGQGGVWYSPVYLSAGGLLTINSGNGIVSAADGSFISLHAGNTNTATPFAFALINGGTDLGGVSNSTVLIDAPAGILQNGIGLNDGITAGTVTLKANSPLSVIKRFGSTQLELRETTNLTIETNGDMSVKLTGGRDLTNLDLTRGKNDATFLLDNGTPDTLSANQTLSVSDNGGGVNLALGVGAGGAALNFRYRNTDPSGNIVGLGINTQGGAVSLESVSSGITTGNIDTTDGFGNDGWVYLSANTGIDVSGTVNAGASSIDAITGGNLAGIGSLQASSVTGTSVFGDIGSSGTPLEISAGTVSLHAVRNLGPGIGGDVFSNLTGTTGVTLNADHGFTVDSDTALTSLAITTRGDQNGDVSLTRIGQTFAWIRNGTAIDINGVASTAPLASLSVNVTAGDLRVVGTGGPSSSIDANALSLFADGNLTLDGTLSRVVLSNASQDFAASGNVLVDGQATLTATGSQQFRTLNTGDVKFQAGGGGISAIGADQFFSSVNDILLQAGGLPNEKIDVTASNSQSFSASRDIRFLGGSDTDTSVTATLNGDGGQFFTSYGNIDLLAGTGTGSSVNATMTGNGNQSFQAFGGTISFGAGTGSSAAVSVTATGSGRQDIDATGDILFSAGGTAGVNSGASVSVTKAGSNTQSLIANGSITLTGGPGDGGKVEVKNTGSGDQELGTTSTCCGLFVATDDVILQGGGGVNSLVLVEATGQQLVRPSGAVAGTTHGILVGGGAGSGASATIRNTAGTADQYIGDPATCCSVDATDNVILQGGNGLNAFALIDTNGRQFIRPITTVSVNGGLGDGASARIHTGKTTSSGTNFLNASQIVGYDFSIDPNCCNYVSELSSINVVAGTGLDAFAEIVSAGSQRLRASSDAGIIGSTAVGGYARVAGLSQNLRMNDMGSTATRGIRAGTGDGANAIVEATGTDADIPSITLSQSRLQTFSAGTLAIEGKGVAGSATALARITSGGRQRISAGTTTLLAGPGDGSDARITSASTTATLFSSPPAAQEISANLTLTGGGAVGASPTTAKAEITSAGSQSISGSTLTLNGGIGQNSWVRVESAEAQSISNTLTLRGGGAVGTPSVGVATPGAAALVRSLSGGQSLGGISLQGGIGTAGGAATDASAMIVNTTGNQTVSGNVTIKSGEDYAPAGIVNLAGAGAQTFSSGSISIGTTTRAVGTVNGLDAPIAGVHYAGIFQLGTGTQTLNGSSITIDNQYAAGPIGITASGAQSLNRGGSAVTVQNSTAAGIAKITAATTQTVTAGNLTVTSSGTAGEAKITAGSTQTFTDSGLMTVQVSAGGGAASIANISGDQIISSSAGLSVLASAGSGSASIDSAAAQTITASTGGLSVQANGGSGSARIHAPGAQYIVARFVDVSTKSIPIATGDAELTAGGNQSIHTTNGLGNANGSLHVAALGSGTARVESGGSQLLEIDYPEVMQQSQIGARDGRITIGEAAGQGFSLVKAADNQDIFARSITIQGGNAADARSKLTAVNTQNISILLGGITVTGGSGTGASALIDPVTQTILSNGAITVTGGSGTNTIGGILGTGDQTILVTSGGANSILVQGGPAGSDGAFGQITTTGDIQRIGTSGGFVLTGGLGSNADAIIGANGGTAETFLACGSGICTAGLPPFDAIPSVNPPFSNPSTNVGVYYSPITVTLPEIIAATGGAPVEESQFGPPFDPTILTLWDPTLPMTEEERQDILFGRRLPVCR